MRRLLDLLPVLLVGQTTGSCFDTRFDYPGHDINLDTGTNTDRRDTAAECQELCRNTSGCNFFTWHVTLKHCWLKTGISTKNPSTTAISGPSQCGSCFDTGFDYPGLDINLDTGTNTDSRDTAAECQELCRNTSGCNFFTWHVTYKHCWLKTGISTKKPSPTAISGPSQCGLPLKAVSALMSSTHSNGEFPAERCIDGREGGSRTGSMCHTDYNGEKAPWLALDFEANVIVEKVVIHNRDDCCEGRLRNAEVRVADQLPDSAQQMFSGGQLLATFTGPAKQREVVTLTSSAGLGGRFVIVQIDNSPGTGILNLNEVTVWGKQQGGDNVFDEYNPEPISVEQLAQWDAEYEAKIWPNPPESLNGFPVLAIVNSLSGTPSECGRGCYWHARGRRCMNSLRRGRCLN